jgi:hypothetical protein
VTVRLASIALLFCACEARVSLPNGDPGVDGNNLDPVDGAPATVDAAPACSNGRVIYLNFDGQSLTQGATSNSKANVASWMNKATGAAPPYRAGTADRDAQIQTIVDGVTQQLSSFPITVVTTRPPTGDYVMVLFGGVQTDVGSNFSVAVQELDCNDPNRNDVAWLTGNVIGQRAINTTLGAVGFGLGLTATSDPNDCMCGWANGCQSNNNIACTLTEGITRDPAANQQCAGAGATQNETAAFDKAFCQ